VTLNGDPELLAGLRFDCHDSILHLCRPNAGGCKERSSIAIIRPVARASSLTTDSRILYTFAQPEGDGVRLNRRPSAEGRADNSCEVRFVGDPSAGLTHPAAPTVKRETAKD
jgi:hypothetical protein